MTWPRSLKSFLETNLWRQLSFGLKNLWTKAEKVFLQINKRTFKVKQSIWSFFNCQKYSITQNNIIQNIKTLNWTKWTNNNGVNTDGVNTDGVDVISCPLWCQQNLQKKDSSFLGPFIRLRGHLDDKIDKIRMIRLIRLTPGLRAPFPISVPPSPPASQCSWTSSRPRPRWRGPGCRTRWART